MTYAGGSGSNPGVPKLWRLVTLKPLKLQQCTYIFRNLQSLSIWTREVKSLPSFLIHDILSGMYLGLLYKIENVCKHSKLTVYLYLYKVSFSSGRLYLLPLLLFATFQSCLDLGHIAAMQIQIRPGHRSLTLN